MVSIPSSGKLPWILWCSDGTLMSMVVWTSALGRPQYLRTGATAGLTLLQELMLLLGGVLAPSVPKRHGCVVLPFHGA